ncbi:MAG TPA: trehalose-phosphatase [Terriglobales bacterium]|nr:trehalose-phosphatase [Terriglobales bacterium]
MATTSEDLEREPFLAHLARAPQAALLLDYDGTLAPFCEERQRALPYPGVSTLLKEIMDEGSTRVVMITGRPAGEVVRLLGVLPYPEIWGAHGLQRLRPDGTCELVAVDHGARQALAEASAWLDRLELRHLAEFKPGSIALHWRGLPESDAADRRSKVLLRWMPLSFRPGMALLEFDGGVELRVGERSKADAVRTVLAELDEGAAIAYLGDDQSDEEAFAALRPRGLAVLARPEWRPTVATLWIKPPRELLDFLAQWLQARRERG